MDIQVNDILTMKSIPIRSTCHCLLPRSKAEKNIRTVEREGEIVC